MGSDILIEVVCDKCNRKMPAVPDGVFARCICGNRIDTRGHNGPKYEFPPVQVGDHGLWLSLIRRFRKPQDRGVGDTVQRLAARLGGERFKKLSARLGIPCGCTTRQAEWNERWPY